MNDVNEARTIREELILGSVWREHALEAQAAYLAALAPAGETRSREGLLAVRTGVWSNTENGVVANDADDGEIAELLALLDGVPGSWNALDPAPGLAERLVRAGCRPERSGNDMGARLDRVEIPAGPGDVSVVEVAGARSAEEWLDVAEACGWIEDRADRERRGRTLLECGRELAAYVARRGGRPVGMARALYVPPLAALVDLAVLPAERRRGIGRALAGARVEEARRRGCELAVLAPSPDGYELYRTLGFELEPPLPDRWFYLPVRPAAQ